MYNLIITIDDLMNQSNKINQSILYKFLFFYSVTRLRTFKTVYLKMDNLFLYN